MARFFKPAAKPQRQLTHGRVDGLDHQLRGVVREPSGHTVFVAGALPGEHITYKPLSKFNAQLIKVRSVVGERRQPSCPYYTQCGGCDTQHITEVTQRQFKQQAVTELLRKFAQLETTNWQPVLHSQGWQYRRKARLATYWNKNSQQLRMGFRAAKSQQVTAIPDCPVLEPELSALIEPLRRQLAELRLGPILGHVELIKTNTQHVVLRLIKPATAQQQQALRVFEAQYQVNFWLQDDTQTNALNPDSIAYDVTRDGDRLGFTPGDFLQVNAAVNQQMVSQALAWLAAPTSATVLDLYAGVGNFSLPLARRVKQVIAIEGVKSMSQRLADNAQRAGLQNVQALTTDLSQVTAKSLAEFQADHWLLDPARAGAYAVAEQLQLMTDAARPRRIVYVSCAADTLARDTRKIVAAGYQLKQLGLVDMFPQTHHIETMACFERVA